MKISERGIQLRVLGLCGLVVLSLGVPDMYPELFAEALKAKPKLIVWYSETILPTHEERAQFHTFADRLPWIGPWMMDQFQQAEAEYMKGYELHRRGYVTTAVPHYVAARRYYGLGLYLPAGVMATIVGFGIGWLIRRYLYSRHNNEQNTEKPALLLHTNGPVRLTDVLKRRTRWWWRYLWSIGTERIEFAGEDIAVAPWQIATIKDRCPQLYKIWETDELGSIGSELVALLTIHREWPASVASKAHGNYEGGLIDHVEALVDAMKRAKATRLELLWCLGHDIGKILTFTKTEDGCWVRETNTHAQLSYVLLRNMNSIQADLTATDRDVLLQAIRHHHSASALPPEPNRARELFKVCGMFDRKVACQQSERHKLPPIPFMEKLIEADMSDAVVDLEVDDLEESDAVLDPTGLLFVKKTALGRLLQDIVVDGEYIAAELLQSDVSKPGWKAEVWLAAFLEGLDRAGWLVPTVRGIEAYDGQYRVSVGNQTTSHRCVAFDTSWLDQDIVGQWPAKRVCVEAIEISSEERQRKQLVDGFADHDTSKNEDKKAASKQSSHKSSSSSKEELPWADLHFIQNPDEEQREEFPVVTTDLGFLGLVTQDSPYRSEISPREVWRCRIEQGHNEKGHIIYYLDPKEDVTEHIRQEASKHQSNHPTISDKEAFFHALHTRQHRQGVESVMLTRDGQPVGVGSVLDVVFREEKGESSGKGKSNTKLKAWIGQRAILISTHDQYRTSKRPKSGETWRVKIVGYFVNSQAYFCQPCEKIDTFASTSARGDTPDIIDIEPESPDDIEDFLDRSA